jgi:hypothetical protein
MQTATHTTRPPFVIQWELQTVEQMMAASPRRSARNSEPPPLPPDELKRVVHQGLTDHYRRTLDEPIPALGNRSPRQAAKTAKGRDKVIAWLQDAGERLRTAGPRRPNDELRRHLDMGGTRYLGASAMKES